MIMRAKTTLLFVSKGEVCGGVGTSRPEGVHGGGGIGRAVWCYRGGISVDVQTVAIEQDLVVGERHRLPSELIYCALVFLSSCGRQVSRWLTSRTERCEAPHIPAPITLLPFF